MGLRDVELYRVRMPLVQTFASARGSVDAKEALLVRVRTDDAIGWGECTAQSDPTYAPDTVGGARLALLDHVLPRAFAGAPLDDVRGHTAARAAFECALLDARLRADGVSLSSYLGGTRATVTAGVAVGLGADDAALAAAVAAYVEQGYTRVKCKIAPGRDASVLRAARAAAGAGIELAADANGSYSSDDARRILASLDDLDLQCIEQPLAPDELSASARLASELRTPICLDESITSVARAADAIAARAGDALSIKAGSVGGLAAAVRAHDACVAAGVPALAGGMLETGVGRAALLALASLPGFTMTGDASASSRYFGPDGDLTEPFELVAGALRVPTGPGLGVEPIPEQLARYTIARERVTARGSA